MRSRLSVLSGVREAKSGRSSPDIPGSLNAFCHLWTTEGLGFRVLGFRVLGFRVLGLRV